MKTTQNWPWMREIVHCAVMADSRRGRARRTIKWCIERLMIPYRCVIERGICHICQAWWQWLWLPREWHRWCLGLRRSLVWTGCQGRGRVANIWTNNLHIHNRFLCDDLKNTKSKKFTDIPVCFTTPSWKMSILYYTILYYTILYYTILYYIILYYTILYYTILLQNITSSQE